MNKTQKSQFEQYYFTVAELRLNVGRFQDAVGLRVGMDESRGFAIIPLNLSSMTLQEVINRRSARKIQSFQKLLFYLILRCKIYSLY